VDKETFETKLSELIQSIDFMDGEAHFVTSWVLCAETNSRDGFNLFVFTNKDSRDWVINGMLSTALQRGTSPIFVIPIEGNDEEEGK